MAQYNLGHIGFNPTGSWTTGTTYSKMDTVFYLNNSYVCILTHTSSSSILPTNKTYWSQMTATPTLSTSDIKIDGDEDYSLNDVIGVNANNSKTTIPNGFEADDSSSVDGDLTVTDGIKATTLISIDGSKSATVKKLITDVEDVKNRTQYISTNNSYVEIDNPATFADAVFFSEAPYIDGKTLKSFVLTNVEAQHFNTLTADDISNRSLSSETIKLSGNDLGTQISDIKETTDNVDLLIRTTGYQFNLNGTNSKTITLPHYLKGEEIFLERIDGEEWDVTIRIYSGSSALIFDEDYSTEIDEIVYGGVISTGTSYKDLTIKVYSEDSLDMANFKLYIK